MGFLNNDIFPSSRVSDCIDGTLEVDGVVGWDDMEMFIPFDTTGRDIAVVESALCKVLESCFNKNRSLAYHCLMVDDVPSSAYPVYEKGCSPVAVTMDHGALWFQMVHGGDSVIVGLSEYNHLKGYVNIEGWTVMDRLTPAALANIRREKIRRFDSIFFDMLDACSRVSNRILSYPHGSTFTTALNQCFAMVEKEDITASKLISHPCNFNRFLRAGLADGNSPLNGIHTPAPSGRRSGPPR